jgi:hypothetical protein
MIIRDPVVLLALGFSGIGFVILKQAVSSELAVLTHGLAVFLLTGGIFQKENRLVFFVVKAWDSGCDTFLTASPDAPDSQLVPRKGCFSNWFQMCTGSNWWVNTSENCALTHADRVLDIPRADQHFFFPAMDLFIFLDPVNDFTGV